MFFFVAALAQSDPVLTSSADIRLAYFFDEERLDAPIDAVIVYRGFGVYPVLTVNEQEVELFTTIIPNDDAGLSVVQPPEGGWPVGVDLVVDLIEIESGELSDTLSFRSDGHLALPPTEPEITYTVEDWDRLEFTPRRYIRFSLSMENSESWDRSLLLSSNTWIPYHLEHTMSESQHYREGEFSPQCFSVRVMSEAGFLTEEQVYCPEGEPPPPPPPSTDDPHEEGEACGCSSSGSLSSLLLFPSLLFVSRRRKKQRSTS